jgi:phage terminase large subunit-like protein
LDYPELCEPMMRNRGTTASDNRQMMQQRSGFVFSAKGAGSTALGTKVGNVRPDLIIMDDIEPPAADYSVYKMQQRLDLIRQSLLPMNAHARVVLVGTVTMDGSIVHQLVRSVTSHDVAGWITAERFRTFYHAALITNDDGTERSLWPEKWPLAELQSMRHDRYFAINFQNLPLAADGAMWQMGDITHVADQAVYPRSFLSIDPAVTSKERSKGQKESDATGVALLGHDRQTGRVYVRESWALRLDPKALRTWVAARLAEHPEVRLILVETNQGGDVWREILGGFPDVAYESVNQSVKKETRAEFLLNAYQRRQVVHVGTHESLERELLAFPNGLHDDQVDAVGTGFTWVTGAGQARRTSLRRAVA